MIGQTTCSTHTHVARYERRREWADWPPTEDNVFQNAQHYNVIVPAPTSASATEGVPTDAMITVNSDSRFVRMSFVMTAECRDQGGVQLVEVPDHWYAMLWRDNNAGASDAGKRLRDLRINETVGHGDAVYMAMPRTSESVRLNFCICQQNAVVVVRRIDSPEHGVLTLWVTFY